MRRDHGDDFHVVAVQIDHPHLVEPAVRLAYGSRPAAIFNCPLRTTRAIRAPSPRWLTMVSHCDSPPVRMRTGGESQWLTIVSQRGLGARIALVGVRNGQLKITAQSAPIGQANRWLNPVGVVDLDGDGEAEIVAVVTPHLAGVLTVYQQQGSELVARATLRGLSNHRFGSTELGRSGFIPDAQGATVVVPNLEHQALVMVRYAHGALRETGRCPLPAPVVGAVRWAANTGLTAVLSTGAYTVDRATCGS